MTHLLLLQTEDGASECDSLLVSLADETTLVVAVVMEGGVVGFTTKGLGLPAVSTPFHCCQISADDQHFAGFGCVSIILLT